jgi:Nitroreductase
LGTYGFVSGASDFLTLVYEESPLADEGSAYLFEQVVLFCTELGLGTCWLGGSFSRKNFGNQLALQPNEKLRIVSPVGYPSDKKRLWETVMGADKNHASRKPFGTYFFDNDFSQSLSEEKTGDFRVPLEMVRIAPSANNSQPWRIVLQKDTAHFYYRPAMGGFSAIDLGIAMCHFEQTCRELSISGEFEVLDTPIIPLAPKDCRYVISWKRQNEKY